MKIELETCLFFLWNNWMGLLDYAVKGLLEYVKIVRKNSRNLRKNVITGKLFRIFYIFVYVFNGEFCDGD